MPEEKKPEDRVGRIWFNWPLSLGLVVNFLIWAALAGWFFLRRR
jgi:hypothetical protein